MRSKNLSDSVQENTGFWRNSNRVLGITFAIIFILIGLFPLLSDNTPLVWAIGTSGLLVFLAIVTPRSLGPLTRLWLRLGDLLHVFMTPIVLAFIYLLSVIPVGLLMRVFGKDPLHRRFERSAKSYWVVRQQPGPKPESLYRQF